MKDFVPKGNHSLRVRGTSSGPTPSDNAAPGTVGDFDASAQIGADPTDSRDVTVSALGGAEQTGSGYGYDITWMLPLQPAVFVGTGPTPEPAQPSVNQKATADQIIAAPIPAAAAPPFFFFSDGADASVSSMAPQPVLISSAAITISPTSTLNGNTTPGGGIVGAASGLLQVSRLDQPSDFGGTVAGMSGQGGSSVSATNVITPYNSISEGSYNPKISLLSQFTASALVTGSAGYAYAVTAQAPANHSVFIAAAPPKA